MPTTEINFKSAHDALAMESPNVLSTPFGLCILEIQGELNLPSLVPDSSDSANFIKIDNIYDAVKFGRLEFDPKDSTKVTLFVGNSQRLIGSVVNLDTPLGVMKIATQDDKIQIVDVVKKKMIFKHRPLPIM